MARPWLQFSCMKTANRMRVHGGAILEGAPGAGAAPDLAEAALDIRASCVGPGCMTLVENETTP